MNPLTEKQLRTSFINTTKRETTQAALPDLAELSWDRLDYLGWRDRKAPLLAYVVLELDGQPTGIMLRAGAANQTMVRRKALCAWCRDLASVEAAMYVARRGGSAGRAGNTIGTLVCEDFSCSRNVRRPPTSSEAGTDPEQVRDLIVQERIAGLRERAARFVQEVAATL
ncbi:translation elongation factor [Intrasporangium chromatireducens Q5-1]|uniref:Translation elongation factor n=1 Tax=Intrasporangium chromatireducens Q5-1 TaxID=584657 RepID=W9GPE5_9MICO|nr:FBP domain-containing protein [Intrasporangium chromatireducens]EWT06947.1 translation elongation factor [Intrasporangium chromatireducens Q5-1]